MTVLLAVGIAVFVFGVLAVAFSFLSSREAGRSAEDLSVGIVPVPGTHGDACLWDTMAFPRLVPDEMRAKVVDLRAPVQDVAEMPEVTA